MKLTKAKTITALAGLGALAVVLTVATFWREFVYAVYPEARLWGRWSSLKQSLSITDLENLFVDIIIVEFTQHRVVKRSTHSSVLGPLFTPLLSQEYRVEGEKILFLDVNGEVVESWKFRFEGGDTMVVVDEQDALTMLYRLPPED